MNDIESTINGERERIRSEQASRKASRRFNMGKRILTGTAAAGLAALALALSLRGGNGEYDQATKDNLKASLRPTAVKIARGAVRASTGWDRDKEGNKIIINLSDVVQPIGKGPRSYPYTPMDIGVTTGISDGRPDPRKVESVSISSGEFGNSRTVYIDSPRSDNLPDSFFTDGQDYSGHGAWSGSVIELNGQFGVRRGFQANTDNEFVASEAIGIIDPEGDARIQTADMVAAMAGGLYDRLHDQRPDMWPDSSAQPR